MTTVFRPRSMLELCFGTEFERGGSKVNKGQSKRLFSVLYLVVAIVSAPFIHSPIEDAYQDHVLGPQERKYRGQQRRASFEREKALAEEEKDIEVGMPRPSSDPSPISSGGSFMFSPVEPSRGGQMASFPPFINFQREDRNLIAAGMILIFFVGAYFLIWAGINGIVIYIRDGAGDRDDQ